MTVYLLLLMWIVSFLLLPILLPILTVYMSYTAGVLLEAGTAYPSRAPEFTPVFFMGFVMLNFFSFLCRPIMCLSLLSSVL